MMTLKCLLLSLFLVCLFWGNACGRISGPVSVSNNIFGPRDDLDDYDFEGEKTERDVELIETMNPEIDFSSAVLKQIYTSFHERIDFMDKRLTNVEKNTKEIKDRLTKLDCYDVKVEDPLAPSGVYNFFLDYKGKRPVSMACDMITEGGGWTIMQRRHPREENSTERQTEFHRRNLHDYTLGFGSPSSDYWLGLENLYILTHTRNYELRIDLQDFEDHRSHAKYSKFYLEGESTGYRIHVSGYSGNSGDSLSSDKGLDNFTADGMLFSTHDHDRDTSHEINCADHYEIGGWWFNRCSWANLNGPYKFPGEEEKCIGINWHKWRNMQCLKGTKMMIRPVRND